MSDSASANQWIVDPTSGGLVFETVDLKHGPGEVRWSDETQAERAAIRSLDSGGIGAQLLSISTNAPDASQVEIRSKGGGLISSLLLDADDSGTTRVAANTASGLFILADEDGRSSAVQCPDGTSRTVLTSGLETVEIDVNPYGSANVPHGLPAAPTCVVISLVDVGGGLGYNVQAHTHTHSAVTFGVRVAVDAPGDWTGHVVGVSWIAITTS